MTFPFTTAEIARNSKRISRYLLIYIAGMGLVTFFGVDFSALSAGILQLSIALALMTSRSLSLNVSAHIARHKVLFTVWLLWLLLAIHAGLQSPVLDEAQDLETVISWTRLLCYVSYFVLGLAMYLFFRQVPLEQALLVKAMSWLMMAIIVNMLFVYLLYPELRDAHSWANKPPGYSNIRHAGYHVCIVSIFILFLLQNNNSQKHFVMFSIMLMCFWAFNFWSGGRGSVVAAFVGSLAFVVMLFWKGLAWKPVLMSLLLALCFGFLLAEFLAVFPWNSFLSAFQTTIVAPDLERISAGRTQHWLHALDIIKDNTFSGIGTGLYRFSDAHVPLSHPHNFILQFAVDWGVIGALCMVFLLAYFFLKACLINLRVGNEPGVFGLCCGAVVLALLALGMIDGTLYHTQPAFYLMVAMVFWMLATPAEKRKS